MIRQNYPENIPYLDPSDFAATTFNMQETADRKGLAIIDSGELVTGPLMENVAKHLGKLMTARRPSVREIAHNGAVIPIGNLKPSDIDETQQVFSREGMGLHTDESGLPAHEQPSYFLLGCITPPNVHEGGDTVITLNQPILNALSPGQQEILAQTYQRFPRDGNRVSETPFLSVHDGKPCFSMWDAGAYGEKWVLDPPDGAYQHEVDGAVKVFFDAALDPEHMWRMPWEENRILVADNHAMVHGRTPQTGPSSRQLLHVKVAPYDE